MLQLIAMLAVLLYSGAMAQLSPKFNTTAEHVTVKAGEKAILPCTVEYIGDNDLIWVSPRHQLISLADRRMIDDQRITIERPYVKEWNLHINDVRFNDSGIYKCKINTDPVQAKDVTLSVLVPPSIISRLSSDNIRVKEGDTAELICNVTGVPQPNVTWHKRNYRHGNKERIGLEGEMLLIHNVTRYCDDIYECFVDNGVAPAVSKAIKVVVEFAPEVVMTNKRMGQRYGRETILECTIYAFPQGMTFWKRNGFQIQNNEKFWTEIYQDDANRVVTLSLRISKIDRTDFGSYTCEGSNYLGSDEEEMILYEIKQRSTTTTTTTTTLGPRYEVMTQRSRVDNGGYPGIYDSRLSTTPRQALWPPIEDPNTYDNEYEDNKLVLGLNGSTSCHTRNVIVFLLVSLALTVYHSGVAS